MEVGAANVKGVDVGGQHAAEEEDAVDEGVGVGAGEQEDGGWGKEDCEEGEGEAVEHFGGVVGTWSLMVMS